MATTSNMPVIRIPRAGTMHEFPLSKFLPDQVRQAANPSEPNEIGICHAEGEKNPRNLSLCVYDQTQTIRPSDLSSSIGALGEQEFDDFKGLRAASGRSYQPVFFCSGSVVTDSIYDYYGEVASHLRGQGITPSHYDNFRAILRQCGFTFVGAAHFSVESASFFIRGGARFLEEFIDVSLFDSLSSQLDTQHYRLNGVVVAHLINHKGEKKLIHLKLRDTSINERFALLARVQQVKQLIGLIQTAPSTNDAISTICEIMDDMKERGIPLPVDFLALNSNTVLARRVIARQSEMLWNHTYKLTTLYTDAEIEEFIGWLDQA